MASCAPEAADHARAAGYCRAARRLRGEFSRQPGRLHRELRDLADRQGRPARKEQRFPGDRVLPDPGARSRAFATDVASRLEGPVLRHSQRRRLLKTAERAGIGRFEANLIIAAVQHERRGNDARTLGSPIHERKQPTGSLTLWPVGLVVAIQAMIGWGAWRIWCA
jgi:hypothetical protein